MIRFYCPDCGLKVRAPESAVGRSGRCPCCGCRVVVPAEGLVDAAGKESEPSGPDYLARGADTVGPLSEEAVRELVASGAVTLSDRVWPCPAGPWKEVGKAIPFGPTLGLDEGDIRVLEAIWDEITQGQPPAGG